VKVWAEREATDYETGREAARALLAKQRIDGVFCVTDLLALGFLDAARFEHGRRVPDDLSVIGFDDIAQAAWDAYRLTTFRQPVGNLAAAVMKAIRRRMKDPGATHDLETVPIELVVRSTVRGFAEKDLAA
jgi:DNA-binding LacI/PurR family transcriptional regulator